MSDRQRHGSPAALVIILAALILIGGAITAWGQSAENCAPRASFEAHLKAAYDEHLVATGGTSSQDVMHLYIAPSTGTWSIAAYAPNGLLCLLATGHNFTLHALEAEGEDG